jgi:hypothetical protein
MHSPEVLAPAAAMHANWLLNKKENRRKNKIKNHSG